MTLPYVSLVICTYNRGDILEECLNSLVWQTASLFKYNVIIVDNGSQDSTAVISQQFVDSYDNFSYYLEPQLGLSYARNRGYQEASTSWIGYVDDDAKAHANYVERALWIIEHYSFDAFGGRYLPWYKNRKPNWIADDFGTNGKLLPQVGILKEKNMSGGVAFYKKSVLEQLGGFATNLGMSGKKIAYGEESHLQNRMRAQGYVIGFDPDLMIDHLVPLYKQQIWWLLRSEFHRALVFWKKRERIPSFKDLLESLKDVSVYTLKRVVLNVRFLTKTGYFWQNYVLDTFSPTVRSWGKILGYPWFKKLLKKE